MLLASSRDIFQDSGEETKVKGTLKVGAFFHVCAFSIQRTRLSRSLEQTITATCSAVNTGGLPGAGRGQPWFVLVVFHIFIAGSCSSLFSQIMLYPCLN